MGKPLFTEIHPATGGGFDAVELGQVREVGHLDNPFTVMVSGTFVATILIQISMDGTNWATFASVSAPGVTKVDVPCKQVRGNCSAFTSGLAVVLLGGKNSTNADDI